MRLFPTNVRSKSLQFASGVAVISRHHAHVAIGDFSTFTAHSKPSVLLGTEIPEAVIAVSDIDVPLDGGDYVRS